MQVGDNPPASAVATTQRPVLGVVALAGLGLVLFGSNQSKLFGVAYLIILVGLFGLLPLLEWFERRAAFIRAVDSCRRIRRGLLTRCPWLPQAIVASTGILLCVYFAIRRVDFPPLISAFYVLLGLALIGWAVAPIHADRSADGLSRRGPWLLIVGLAICLLPVAALGLSVVEYATNAPFFDEYISTLAFAANFADMTGAERFAELIGVHFGHRIVFTRLATLAQVEVFGELNFYRMILFNYVLLVAGAVFVYFSIQRPLRIPLLFAPFLFILFQPQYHQITLWAFGSPHLSSFFLTAATFLLLAARTALGFWLALVCALIAAFTFATGLFAGVTGLAVLLDQRRYREALYWLMPITLLEMRYFSDLDLNAGKDEGMAAFGFPPVGARDKAFYALEFLGSLATLGVFSDFLGHSVSQLTEFESARYIARSLGAAFIALFAYISLRRYWRVNPVVYGLLAIMITSAALAADQRAHAVDSAFLSRYMINSCLVAGLIYLALLQLHPNAFRALLPVSLVGSALFCACSFLVTLPYARYHQRDLQFGGLLAANGLYQHTMPVAPGLPLFRLNQLMKASEQGIYAIPTREFAARFEAGPFDVPAQWLFSDEPGWVVSHIGENPESYVFILAPVGSDRSPPAVGVVLADQTGAALAFRATAFEDFPGHSDLIDAITPDGSTHYAVIPKSKLKDGPRRVAVATMRDRTATVHLSDHYVPTVRETKPSLLPATTPDMVHLTSTCSDMVIDTDEGCWFEDGRAGVPVELSQSFTVQLLAVKGEATAGNVELWRVDFRDENSLRSLRLSLERGWFALSANYDGAEPEDLAKVEASVDAPNWVAVVVNGRDVGLIAASPNEFGALTAVHAGEGELRASPDSHGTLHLGDGTNIYGQPAIRMREISIREGAMTVEDVVSGWPLFDLSLN